MSGVLPPVALEKGYFRDGGLQAQIERVPSGQDALVLVATGKLDAAVAGLFAATFSGIEQGLDVKVVGSLDRFPSKEHVPALMVRTDLVEKHQVGTLADLRGRRVASFGGGGGTGAYLISLALRDAGLTATDIDLVNLGFAETIAAFKNAAIDAAYLPEPFATQASQTGVAEVFGPGVPAGLYTVGVLYNGAFMRERPAAAHSTMQALVRAARDLRGDGYRQPENLGIVSGHTHLAPATFATLGSLDLQPDLLPDADTLLDMQQVYMRLGVLSYGNPLPPDRLMDASFAEQAGVVLPPHTTNQP